MLNLFQSIQEVGGEDATCISGWISCTLKDFQNTPQTLFSRCKPPLNRQFFHVLSWFVHYVLTSNQNFFFFVNMTKYTPFPPNSVCFVPPNNVRTYCLVLKKYPIYMSFLKLFFMRISTSIQVLSLHKIMFWCIIFIPVLVPRAFGLIFLSRLNWVQ